MSTSLISQRSKSKALEFTPNYSQGLANSRAVKVLGNMRYGVGVGTVVTGLTAFFGTCTEIAWLIGAAGAVDPIGLSGSEHLIVLGATVASAGLAGLGVAAQEQREYNTHYSKLSTFLFHRRLRKENETLGWRPRKDAPKLSPDEQTHPRWVLNKTVVDKDFQDWEVRDLQYEGTDTWVGNNPYQGVHYCLEIFPFEFYGTVWHQNRKIKTVRVPVGDEETLVAQIDALQTEVDEKNLELFRQYITEMEQGNQQEKARQLLLQEKNQIATERKVQAEHAKTILQRLEC